MDRTMIGPRTLRLVTTGVAAVAVAGVMIGTAAVTGTDDTAVAGTGGGSVAAAPAAKPVQKKAPKTTKYVFQNQRSAVASLGPGQEVSLGDHQFFATRGTQWAVISRVPGEPEYEPFGWRATVGNDNLGDGTSLGLQISGAVHSSVFKSDQVSTVVYTRGTKAWYAKVHRLAGIPGWVQSSALIPADKQSTTTPGPSGPRVSVFGYDKNGKLLGRFGDAKDVPQVK